jgi:murein tripeptide amidase MpaA
MPTPNQFIPLITLCCITILHSPGFAQQSDPLKTRAESSKFEETSRYNDVMLFLQQLQRRSELARFTYFGISQDGRKLPLLILSNPPVSSPQEAKNNGKPIILILANIHAGEVEGKEASQQLARRLLLGDLKPLLSKLTVLIAPIYNVDGNEKISTNNRPEQYGPISGVGTRENSQKFDLNRDYMKLEAPESQSLVKLLNKWDPHITVDLHTTNGSYHAYHVTYSSPLNPNSDQKIFEYHRNQMLPAIGAAIRKKHDFRSYFYGNFTGFSNRPKQGEETTWEAFTHQPRIGQNYVGIRNRISILSEAYSYLPFQRRVEVTERFVEEILHYSATNADTILKLTRSADEATVKQFDGDNPVEFGVNFKPIALPEKVEILVGDVEKKFNQKSGKEMKVMIEDKVTPMKMLEYALFSPTRSVKAPRAYLFPKDNLLVQKCLQHGIIVEELLTDTTIEVDEFTTEKIERSTRIFQGHIESNVTGKYKTINKSFPTGSILIRTNQPLGRLVCYLLEPESTDGLITWNFLESHLEIGKSLPIYKVMKRQNLVSQIITE